MSRIGKMPVVIPAGVDVKLDGNHITVKGPKGELALDYNPQVSVEVKDTEIVVTRPSDDKVHRSLHGLGISLRYAGYHIGNKRTGQTVK